ncbi:MAG: replication-relaxation family protein, partial [Pseudonocardiales bacterium]|nr:replication-relaxation family protein [Pseudonocardiales bacterium]
MPQRRLHGTRAARDMTRAVNTVEHRARLAARLTPRDRWIVRMVHEHRVLDADQIGAMAFNSPTVSRRRLLMLYRASVLDRFQPYLRAGHLPEHYVLGPTGASLLAGELDVDSRRLGYRRDIANGIASSPRLAHLVALNGWFTALVATARRCPDARVEAWWSETRCARHFGDKVRPDGYGRYTERGRRIEFFLEYDMGTE